jgi:amino acid transporter
VKRGSAEKLGLRELTAIGIGSMIGGGIFSVMGLARGQRSPE